MNSQIFFFNVNVKLGLSTTKILLIQLALKKQGNTLDKNLYLSKNSAPTPGR